MNPLFDDGERAEPAILKVLLPAYKIPDGSQVSKRTGEMVYTLNKQIKVYPDKSLDSKVELDVKGCFLFGPRGGINQIDPNLELHWLVEAEYLYFYLEEQGHTNQ